MYKGIILSVDSHHGAKNMCCGDGVSLTFLAVMRCSLIFFAVLWCSEPSHVPLFVCFALACLNIYLPFIQLSLFVQGTSVSYSWFSHDVTKIQTTNY